MTKNLKKGESPSSEFIGINKISNSLFKEMCFIYEKINRKDLEYEELLNECAISTKIYIKNLKKEDLLKRELNLLDDNENYVDIFNYGNNPLISYKGSDNSLQISFEGLKEDGSENNSTEPINIIINNFEFQKWNNIVINCRSGQHIDIFINTKLVASEKIVIGKFDNEKNIEIGDSDLRGAACNIVYYNRTLPIWSIYLSYYIYSSMEIPYISISKDKEDKEKNKNLEDRDFKTESELAQERNKKLEDKYNDNTNYTYKGDNNKFTVLSDEEKLKNVPGTHKVNNLLWFKFFS